MKKLPIFILLLIICKQSSAQTNTNNFSLDFASITLGAGKPLMNNRSFDSWTELNYKRKDVNNVSGNVDFNFALKGYDFGVTLGGSSGDFNYASLYFGKRLTTAGSWIASYLNFAVGYYFVNDTNLAPVNYTLTPDEVGQKLELHYSTGYLGLNSKNYFNKLSFRMGKKKRVSFKSGFYINAGYEPWITNWKYGYNKETDYTDPDGGTGTSSDFIHKNVYSIPRLANSFVDAGVFIGIAIY